MCAAIPLPYIGIDSFCTGRKLYINPNKSAHVQIARGINKSIPTDFPFPLRFYCSSTLLDFSYVVTTQVPTDGNPLE